MARYRKIFTKMWGDGKFRQLSAPGPNGQTLWFFLLTGPQTTRIPGLFSLGEAGFAEIIGWSLEGFRKVFQEVLTKDLVKADWEARLVWIPKAILYNQPENPNVVKGWKDTWDEMPECELKLQVFHQLECFLKKLGDGFEKAFREACSKPSGNPLGNPSPNPLANQEQEQEQEQEKEQENFPPSEGEPDWFTAIGPSASAEVKYTEQIPIESTPTQTRTHPRLEVFVEEYFLAKGQVYLVGNYQAEGGAAKRTLAPIPDDSLYRQAVRAYLANIEKRLTENGHPFMWFIRDLNRWVLKARGDMHVRENSQKYDTVCE